MLPKDPALHLSVVTTKLRDEYESLEDLCAALDIAPEEISAPLAALGYAYDETQNQFR